MLLLPAESEKRLIKKCRELNAEIVANAAKVQTALKLNEEDQQTIGALKKEIEKAWKMVDASHEKEAKAKETIQQLKIEIANLTRLVEQVRGRLRSLRDCCSSVSALPITVWRSARMRAREQVSTCSKARKVLKGVRSLLQGAGLAIGEETTLNELLKQKEELVRERDAQVRAGCERLDSADAGWHTQRHALHKAAQHDQPADDG